jgi:hypothetical protein
VNKIAQKTGNFRKGKKEQWKKLEKNFKIRRYDIFEGI